MGSGISALIAHYRKLWFFTFNRFRGENYQMMREYFAQLFVGEIEEFMHLEGRRILDVGGAQGEFCRMINQMRSCDITNVDPCPGDYIWPKTEIAFADALPYDDDEFDLVICRGVLEHIPDEKQLASVREMHRVTRAGGICYIVIPPWFNPHAGHRLKPFHILPFRTARFLRNLIFSRKVDSNSFEEAGLYPVTYNKMRSMILSGGFRILATKDCHFRLHILTRIPLVREIAVPSVAFILQKPDTCGK